MKLLVVDDEPSVRKLLQRYFGDQGYDVSVAGDGAEGWEAARDGSPDLILSDVAMPVMDGYELVRTVRRNPATAAIPVILLSAHRGSDDMVEGYRSGADDYIAKPVDVEVLRLKIDALIRRAQPDVTATAPTLGRVICVTSAKGGAGVTTIAANLAVLLGRSHGDSVCAVDLDVAHGDLQVLLDLRPRAGLAEAARDFAAREQGGAHEPVQWDDYLVRHEGGPWLLAAPPTPLEASALNEAGVTPVLAGLRASHQHLVVDVPPSYGELALNIYEGAERVVVVLSPEITALRRTRELLTVLEGLGVDGERVIVVLNSLFEKAAIDRARVEAFLRRPVNLVVPYGGRDFLDAVNNGRPVVVTARKSRPVEALTELAGLL
ncbi:MAG TPA: response regulator [Candidatus Dormibacteraeota bacterium]|jgi:pilus assembly protein CpaE|nr:response regulator [Candidatus Dormibacteraeota bacterium]